MGHYVFKNKEKFSRKIALFVVLTFLVLVYILNIFDLKPQVLTQYDSPLIAIMAVSIFGLFVTKQCNENVWLWKMDRLCFGAYLIHPLFIQFTYRFLYYTPNSFKLYPLATILFCIVFTILAFASSWIMGKICFLKNVL